MVKKSDKRKIQITIKDCDLDGGYVSPVKSLKDLNIENIISLITKSRYVQILLFLILSGSILRFYNLGYNSLWLDEAVTYTTSVKTFTEIWAVIGSGDFNPPLFYWLEKGMLIFGSSEFILRFIPALLGILTIPLFYLIGKEFLDRNAGIIAAALLTFSSFHIYYSQEARAYSPMLFFASLAMLFFLKAIQQNDTKNWILFGLFSAIAFWLHFYVIVLIASLVLFTLIIQLPRYRENILNIKPVFLGIITFCVVCFPLLIITVQRFGARIESAPTFGAQGFEIVYGTFSQMSGAGDLGLFLLIALFIIGLFQAFVIDKKKGFLLLTSLLFTFLISYMLSFKMPMMPRHLLFLLIIIFTGIALAYKPFYSLTRNQGVVYVLIAILILINFPALSNYYSSYTKEDWRGFSGQMQNITQEGDKIVLVPGYMSLPFDYYYSNATDRTYEYGATTIPDLENVSAGRGNETIYFVVTSDIIAVNPNGDQIKWLNERTKFISQDTGIYLFGIK